MAKRKLSKHQKKRLADKRQGAAERAISPSPGRSDSTPPLHPGRVITHFGARALVEDANQQLIQCALRQNLGKLVAGDKVLWHPDKEVGTGVIEQRQPRTQLLTRPGFRGQARMVAANVDQMVIVLGVEPGVHPDVIDRYLVAAHQQQLSCLLVINKMDLLPDPNDRAVIDDLLAPYVSLTKQSNQLRALIFVSTQTGEGMSALQQAMASHASVLVGPSGAGKSSLIKHMVPDQDIRIQSLSQATGLGRHTTSNSILYHCPHTPTPGLLIDTPGVRQFDPTPMALEQLEQAYPDFAPFLGHCQFDNCTHDHEPKCAIIQAVEQDQIAYSRYQSFQRLRQNKPATQTP